MDIPESLAKMSALQTALLIAAMLVVVVGMNYLDYRSRRRRGKRWSLWGGGDPLGLLKYNRREWAWFVLLAALFFALIITAARLGPAGCC